MSIHCLLFTALLRVTITEGVKDHNSPDWLAETSILLLIIFLLCVLFDNTVFTLL